MSAQRERQSVWCCGRSFQRWRFIGRDFPGTHHTHCAHCGKELVWPETRRRGLKPDEKTARQREIWLASYRRVTQRRAAQGLMSRGRKPRRRSPAVLTPLAQAWRAEREAMGVIELPEITATTLMKNR